MRARVMTNILDILNKSGIIYLKDYDLEQY